MVKMMKLVQGNWQNIMDHFNQLNVHDAWFDVSYGGCQSRIFSTACPIEPLHTLRNGINPDCLTILFKDKMRVAWPKWIFCPSMMSCLTSG
jgi:hypothetical protein